MIILMGSIYFLSSQARITDECLKQFSTWTCVSHQFHMITIVRSIELKLSVMQQSFDPNVFVINAWKKFILVIRVYRQPLKKIYCRTMLARQRFRRCLRFLGPAYFVTSLMMFVLTVYMYLSVYIGMPQIEKINNVNSGGQQEPFNVNLRKVHVPKRPFVLDESKKRQNLIIVAHGRSGSSFTGNIFNHHPSVFYLFEPYQTVERLHGKVEPFDKDYEQKSFEWIQAVLQCNFVSSEHVKDLQYYYRKKMGRESKDTQTSIALSSPPFCRYNTSDSRWKLGDACRHPLYQQMLEQVCKNKYSMTVFKALFGRMPKTNIEQLISICDSSSEFECKVLFLVRDPRAIIPSSLAVNFFREKDRIGLAQTRGFSYKNCRITEQNLNIIRSLPSRWKKRVKIYRYEDIALNPSKLLPDLLEFAGLPMDESLSKWLYLASHKPEDKGEQIAAPWRLDSSEGANRWRWKAAPYEVTVIEHYCKHVMKLLGYKPLRLSYETQRNISFNLLEDNFEALTWLKA